MLTCEYSAGIAHAPSYKANDRSVDYVAAIETETETGRSAGQPGNVVTVGRKPILPDTASVLASLISDADAIEHSSFESWASDYGYDVDSRAAESTYRACLAIGLALRSAIGEAGLTALRAAAQDY